MAYEDFYLKTMFPKKLLMANIKHMEEISKKKATLKVAFFYQKFAKNLLKLTFISIFVYTLVMSNKYEKLICIKSVVIDGNSFKEGEIYQIHLEFPYYITGYSKFFLTLSEYREQQINSILDE